ncbi:MAG: FAD-binding oxidoreductase, partial [Pseudomonadota bacterium]
MSVAEIASSTDDILGRLRNAAGADGVLEDASARAFYGTDVYRAGATPLAVLRPDTVEKLQAGVKAATDAGLAIVPRGGGASYTDGYAAPNPASVIVDLGRLDKIVQIDERNATVTVEAGCTWASLRQALDAKGLRTPFFGPFSGIAATVGGSMAQNAISHGSGAYGISAQSALGMDIVVASGELVRAGALAPEAEAPFLRHYGPDLVGLFTGDCGAFGIKARVTLPLLKKKPAAQCASFAFSTFEGLHETMRAVALEGLDDENFAVDAVLMQGQIARSDNAGARAQMA